MGLVMRVRLLLMLSGERWSWIREGYAAAAAAGEVVVMLLLLLLIDSSPSKLVLNIEQAMKTDIGLFWRWLNEQI